jgi:SAM-dependent methyltransferase
MRQMVFHITGTLDRVGLAEPVFHAYESLRSRRGESPVTADGIAVPPAHLRFKVEGRGGRSLAGFLKRGRVDAQTLRNEIRAAGRPLSGRVLDFGIGCGRVARHWHDTPVLMYGTDYNPRLVDWVAENLAFVETETNALAPPLPHPDGFFAVVYAISVLTHLPEELQRQWMREFHRITEPGGLVMVTTQGDAKSWKILPEERARYDAGKLVVRHSRSAGSNLCTTFHPREWFEANLTEGFRLANFVPASISSQDLYVLQRI